MAGEALPPGKPGGDGATPTTMDPWTAYDEFVAGKTIPEIARGSHGGTEAGVLADVEQMREWIRDRVGLPLTDHECDSYRAATNIITLAQSAAMGEGGGAASALRVMKDADDKRDDLLRTVRAREAAKELPL